VKTCDQRGHGRTLGLHSRGTTLSSPFQRCLETQRSKWPEFVTTTKGKKKVTRVVILWVKAPERLSETVMSGWAWVAVGERPHLPHVRVARETNFCAAPTPFCTDAHGSRVRCTHPGAHATAPGREVRARCTPPRVRAVPRRVRSGLAGPRDPGPPVPVGTAVVAVFAVPARYPGAPPIHLPASVVEPALLRRHRNSTAGDRIRHCNCTAADKIYHRIRYTTPLFVWEPLIRVAARPWVPMDKIAILSPPWTFVLPLATRRPEAHTPTLAGLPHRRRPPPIQRWSPPARTRATLTRSLGATLSLRTLSPAHSTRRRC
jgi:hypothetical protein